MRKIVLKVLAIVATMAGVAYCADYAVLRYRISRNLSPYATVAVRFYYEVQEKNQRTEYAFASAQEQTCANSLFPHRGYEPCWFTRRHIERPIKI